MLDLLMFLIDWKEQKKTELNPHSEILGNASY